MDNKTAVLLFLGMSLVTFLPRALPVLLLNRLQLSPKTEKFLRLIPYTAMSALIFPGVFAVENPWFGIAGVAAAALLARHRQSVIVCVLAAIGLNFILYLLF
ncbi:MAG: AzlD domain-containing protein [Oscillospiraceae bacterium]|nr:AzlD domain-containing protein [Oscillospiraceae bacterium]